MIVCGPGNNGGDGLAVARQLRCRGLDAEVALVAARRDSERGRGGPARARAHFGVPIHDCATNTEGCPDRLCCAADVVVDALFGTGLDRPLTGRWLRGGEGDQRGRGAGRRGGHPVGPAGLFRRRAGGDGRGRRDGHVRGPEDRARPAPGVLALRRGGGGRHRDPDLGGRARREARAFGGRGRVRLAAGASADSHKGRFGHSWSSRDARAGRGPRRWRRAQRLSLARAS